MRKTLEIVWTTLKLAVQELTKNKLRTFLSLFGVTIGIFCIIGVLSTVNSLEKNIWTTSRGGLSQQISPEYAFRNSYHIYLKIKKYMDNLLYTPESTA